MGCGGSTASRTPIDANSHPRDPRLEAGILFRRELTRLVTTPHASDSDDSDSASEESEAATDDPDPHQLAELQALLSEQESLKIQLAELRAREDISHRLDDLPPSSIQREDTGVKDFRSRWQGLHGESLEDATCEATQEITALVREELLL